MPHHAGKRERICWRPQWDAAFEGWTKRYINKHSWRCDALDEFEDHLQDCKALFCKLSDYYPAVIEAPHFMRLYQTAISNHFHDKSRHKRAMGGALLVMHPGDTKNSLEDVYLNMTGETTNPGYVKALLEEMPDELKLVLSALTEGKVKLRLKRALKSSARLRQRENLNQRLCRKLGLTTTVDPVGDLRRYIQT